MPIIGCEPSCLLTLRDEYPQLVPGEQSRTVASQSFLIDEFLAKLKTEGKLDIEFNDTGKQVLFHAHCHQRSLAGTASSLNALRLAPGYKVELTNAGCCGMAGSFGYEKEHYDISMTIGEQALFPAGQRQGPRLGGGGDGRLLPPADRARHRPQGTPPGGSPGRRAGVARNIGAVADRQQ